MGIAKTNNYSTVVLHHATTNSSGGLHSERSSRDLQCDRCGQRVREFNAGNISVAMGSTATVNFSLAQSIARPTGDERNGGGNCQRCRLLQWRLHDGDHEFERWLHSERSSRDLQCDRCGQWVREFNAGKYQRCYGYTATVNFSLAQSIETLPDGDERNGGGNCPNAAYSLQWLLHDGDHEF